MIKTECDKCVFAIRENSEQTGCHLGRLQSYKKSGIAEIKDNGSYTINGLCLACRNTQTGDLEEFAESVLIEISPQVTVLIDYRDKDFDREAIVNIIKEKPSQILLVFRDKKISDYNKFLSEAVEGTRVKYRIIKFLDDNRIESVYKSIEGNYVIVGDHVPKDIIKDFSRAIVSDLKTYLLFSRDSCNIISSMIFKYKAQDINDIREYLRSKDNSQDFVCEE